MKTRLISLMLLLAAPLFAQLTPVPRPQPMGWQPPPGQTTVPKAWFTYAEYLEKVIVQANATLKAKEAEIGNLKAQLFNVAQFQDALIAVRLNTDQIKTNTESITSSLTAVKGDTSSILSKIGTTTPPPTGSPAGVETAIAVAVGKPLKLIAEVTNVGATGLTWLWKKNGVKVDSWTTATVTIDSVQLTDSGTYTATATNDKGSAESKAFTLEVLPQ